MHFEWRQKALDETLARLNDEIARTHNADDLATLLHAKMAWSKAQGKLDQDVLAYRLMEPTFPGMQP
jgi:hypothetical protein